MHACVGTLKLLIISYIPLFSILASTGGVYSNHFKWCHMRRGYNMGAHIQKVLTIHTPSKAVYLNILLISLAMYPLSILIEGCGVRD